MGVSITSTMVAIFGANVMNIMMANSTVPTPALTGTYCAAGVLDSASKTVPMAVMAIQAGDPRYIWIAKAN